MPNPTAITLKAHAKLNLALAVGPPTPPKGYHPIASWFVAIDLHDTLRIERLADGVESRHMIRWAGDAPKPTPIDWPIEKDLAVRAHRMLEAHAGRSLPIAMTLEKRTPVGGGLGGGSSDAAAALLGVNALFDLRLSPSQLVAMSVTLGSDIAFFIDDAATPISAHSPPRQAFVTGFGDEIFRMSLTPTAEVLLIVPSFGCPTGLVYQAFDRVPTHATDEGRVRALIYGANRNGWITSASLFNDLAEPACIVEPRLRSILGSLRAVLGASMPVHITGSGSTMFCLPEPVEMDSAIRTIENALPGLILVRSHVI